MEKRIKWESQHLEIDLTSGSLKQSEESPVYTDGEYEDIEEMVAQKLTATPFGLWRIDDALHPMKQFKMWMGHTNFDITRHIAETISQIPGVEVLRIITRYRFIIGVGNCFNVRDTQLLIERLVCDRRPYELEQRKIQNPEVKDTVETLVTYLEANTDIKEWALFVFPNGEVEYTSDLSPDYDEDIMRFEEAKQNTDGILLKSSY